MSFLVPAFLWGLFAIAVPIIIHLFHFRRFKTVYFSNTMLLQNLQQENRTRTRLKHWLIMLMRILMLIALVFAFAQPFIPSESSQGSKRNVVAIYLDNSFSMEAEIEKGKKLDVAKEYAYEIVNSYPADMQFYLITNDFMPNHQRLLSQTDIKPELADIQVSSLSRSTGEIMQKASALAGKGTDMNLYLITDCQANQQKAFKIKDFNYHVFLVPIGNSISNNISIDSCWFENPLKVPGKPEEIKFTITNHSNEPGQNIPVRLLINDTLKAVLEINLEALETGTFGLSYTHSVPGIIRGRIETEDFPVVFDNTLFFDYTLTPETRILHIYDGAAGQRYLSALYGTDSENMKYDAVRSGTEVSSEFRQNKLLICDGLKSISSGMTSQLIDYVKTGHSLLLIPGKEIDIHSYNNLMKEAGFGVIQYAETSKKKIAAVNYKHYLFREVFGKLEQNPDLPAYAYAYPLQLFSNSGADAALNDERGRAIVASKPLESGKIIYCAVPLILENEGFIKHPVFVPLFYNMALYSGASGALYHVMGSESSFDLYTLISNNNSVFHLRDSVTDIIPGFRIIPGGVKITIPAEIDHSGHFGITDGDKQIGTISLNYSRSESKQEVLTSSAYCDMLKDAGVNNISIIEPSGSNFRNQVISQSFGIMLWKFFVIAALLFILCEILIVRFMK